jgi:hypothetical protein
MQTKLEGSTEEEERVEYAARGWKGGLPFLKRVRGVFIMRLMSSPGDPLVVTKYGS